MNLLLVGAVTLGLGLIIIIFSLLHLARDEDDRMEKLAGRVEDWPSALSCCRLRTREVAEAPAPPATGRGQVSGVPAKDFARG